MSPVTQLPDQLATPVGQPVTAVAATDIFSRTAHGLVAGDAVQFTGLTGGAGLSPAPTVYYVIAANLTANTFQVSLTPGGATIDMTTDLTVGTVTKLLTYLGMKSIFTTEQLAHYARYHVLATGALPTDATIINRTVAVNYYQGGNLP